MKAKYELALICQKKATDLVCKKNDKIGSKLKETNNILISLFKDIIKCLIDIHPKLEKKIKSLKAEVEKAQSESAEVIEAADLLQQEAKLYQDEKSQLFQRFQQEQEELLAEINHLQEENKKYLETIIRHSKSYAENVQRPSVDSEDKKKFSLSINSKNNKSLSLKQLKETIEEIYNSKFKYDEKCKDNKIPRETMEQHMYNYLNKKYGLKTLVLEWAGAILLSVKKYLPEDNDVAVFAKIIKNEIDEDFRFVQASVKKTMAEVLKLSLKNKFPLKSVSEISEIANEKMNGFLNEDE